MAGAFAAVAAGRLEFARLSKATLADLSHVLEDMILEHQLPGVVLTGFQVDRNWSAELARYQRLVEPDARTVAVFASGSLGDTGAVLDFHVASSSPLAQEWFIIALTSEFSCALFGEDQLGDIEPPAHEMDRLFDAAWTFEPVLVADFTTMVATAAERVDPVRAAAVRDAVALYPPREPSPTFERRFNRRMFEVLETGRRRWRHELVHVQEVQERLQRASDELTRLERLAAVGTTAATLAHELNNPLAAISMAAEAIQVEAGDGDPPTIVAQAAAIADAAVRAGRMTRGILDLVRVARPTIAPLELGPWLQDVAEELSVAHRRHVVARCELPVTVFVDADRLRHIITNLVTNALQASAPTDPVVVAVDPTQIEVVAIEVIDRGRGIPDELRDHLFEPFRTSRAAEGGTGLGLALARRFAEDQHCRLELSSTGPGGTVFTVRVPRSIETVPSPLPDPPEGTGNAGDRRTTKQVLIIDDDPAVRTSIAQLLRHTGWTVWVAEDVDTAVSAVTQRAVDVVLIDYHLGHGTTAGELIERLEAIRPGLRARTVVITGSLETDLVDGPSLPPVLLKPFSRAQLEAALLDRMQPSDEPV